MNKIVIELCAEDRARLDRIAELLERLAPPTITLEVPTPKAPAPAEEHPTDSTTHLEPPAPAPVDAPVPAPAVKPISLGEFQKAITTRCVESPEVKAKVQALVRSYADSVSLIPEDKRAEVLAALAKL